MARLADLDEKWRILERAAEAVQSEVEKDKSEREPDWSLLWRLGEGAQNTEGSARPLTGPRIPPGESTTILLFVMRQLELALTLVSQLSRHMAVLHDRLDQLEEQVRELTAAKERL